MSGFFRSKKSSKGQRSESSEGTSSNPQTTFQGHMTARRASLLETAPEVPVSSRQAAVPRSSRPLTEVSAPRMPEIHRAPTPGPTSSDSGSSGVQMPPPHLFLPRMIPALPVVDGSGTPIYPLPPPVAPSAAYRFLPFDTPLISARVSSSATEPESVASSSGNQSGNLITFKGSYIYILIINLAESCHRHKEEERPRHRESSREDGEYHGEDPHRY